MRTWIAFALVLAGCSGGAPYDIPKDPPGASTTPPASQGAPPEESVEEPTPAPDVDAGSGEDATVGADADVDAPSDGASDAGHDAKGRDAGHDARATACSGPGDCPLLEACLVNEKPPVCGTNNDCSNGGVCNGGCCDGRLFGARCTDGNDDHACGGAGEACVDCRLSLRRCVNHGCR